MSAAELPQSVRKYEGDRREDWRTPRDFFERLHAEFGFTLDAAASDENHLLPKYFTRETDGLGHSWNGETVWVNPPYGPNVKQWTAKACEEAAGGATVVMLVFSYTDSEWFRRDVMRASEVRFIRGRLIFGHGEGKPSSNAPHGSMVVVWRPGESGFPSIVSCDKSAQRTLP